MAALAEAQAPGVRYVPAYDDPAVVAGQGTVTAEAVADAPEVDAVVVAAGGGGLSAGAVLGAGGRTVVVVEPENCCCVHRALEAGRPVDSRRRLGRGLGAGGDAGGGRAVRGAVVGGCGVRARHGRRVARRAGPALGGVPAGVEPAAAVPFAAWLAGRVPGERACLVLCGANT